MDELRAHGLQGILGKQHVPTSLLVKCELNRCRTTSHGGRGEGGSSPARFCTCKTQGMLCQKTILSHSCPHYSPSPPPTLLTLTSTHTTHPHLHPHYPPTPILPTLTSSLTTHPHYKPKPPKFTFTPTNHSPVHKWVL